jgi:hypothetical protein
VSLVSEPLSYGDEWGHQLAAGRALAGGATAGCASPGLAWWAGRRCRDFESIIDSYRVLLLSMALEGELVAGDAWLAHCRAGQLSGKLLSVLVVVVGA